MSQQGLLSDLTSAAANIETITGNSGGAITPDGLFNLNILGGTGIDAVGNAGTNTITLNTTGGFLTWTRVAGVAQVISVDNGYIPTNAALTEFTLPAVAAVGDEIEIVGEGLAGWSILQLAGQSIRFGNLSTTVGVAGKLNSTGRYDTVRLICRVANTTFHVVGTIGTLNAI